MIPKQSQNDPKTIPKRSQHDPKLISKIIQNESKVIPNLSKNESNVNPLENVDDFYFCLHFSSRVLAGVLPPAGHIFEK